MKIGLFGGTFDPVHVGHLDVALAALDAAGLDEVWFVPARTPPHRHHPLASAAHRFAMVALAIAGRPRLRLSDIEMETAGPSYTIDTLDRVAASDEGSGHTLHFVIGADAFADIAAWRAYPDILDRCHFIVVSRPGHDVVTSAQRLPGLAERRWLTPGVVPDRPSILLVEAPTAAVSSTAVRDACRHRRPLAGLVPPAVADYIQRQRLYLKTMETPHE